MIYDQLRLIVYLYIHESNALNNLSSIGFIPFENREQRKTLGPARTQKIISQKSFIICIFSVDLLVCLNQYGYAEKNLKINIKF
jgi:hypothetical protein